MTEDQEAIRESPFDDRRLNLIATRNLDPLDAVEACEDIRKLQAVAEAAKKFVATTSYFRQVKASRPEFEKLAVALIVLRGSSCLFAPRAASLRAAGGSAVSAVDRCNAVRKRIPFAYWITYDVVALPLMAWGAVALSAWFFVGLAMLAFAAFFDVTEAIVKRDERG